MAERRPLVRVNGKTVQLPAGDTLPSSAPTPNNVIYQWDFLNTTVTADIWTGFAISGGNVSGSAGVTMSSNHPGVVRLASTATINSGYRWVSGVNNANGGLLVSDGTKFSSIFAAPGGTTESYIGIHNGSNTEPTTGAYFNIQGTTVVAKCTNSSTTTATTLGTISADTFYLFTATADFTNGFVFEVRDMAGALVYTTTITTNLPAAVTGTGVSSFSTVATAQAVGYIDLMRLEIPQLQRGY